MTLIEPVRVDGLTAYVRQLRAVDRALPTALRVALNDAAGVVVDDARARMPRRSGRAARSIRPRSTRTAVRIIAGSKRVPYYPWLDYGGKVGRHRSVDRRFIKGGRYLYPSYHDNRPAVVDAVERALRSSIAAAGLGGD